MAQEKKAEKPELIEDKDLDEASGGLPLPFKINRVGVAQKVEIGALKAGILE